MTWFTMLSSARCLAWANDGSVCPFRTLIGVRHVLRCCRWGNALNLRTPEFTLPWSMR